MRMVPSEIYVFIAMCFRVVMKLKYQSINWRFVQPRGQYW